MLIQETVPTARAKVRVHHERAYDFDETTQLWVYRTEGEDEEAYNLITNTGRVQLHTQGYGTAAILSNGFNWIALSNDGGAPAATDTLLTGELTGAGLDRVQGNVTLPVGSGNQTTVAHTFTFSGGSQAVQKTALFTVIGPPPAGVMNHEIAFTQRTLVTNDTITLTFSINLG